MRRWRSVAFFFLLVSTTTLFAQASDVIWNVTWYHMDGPGIFNYVRKLAEMEYPFEFDNDWGSGTVLPNSLLLKSARWPQRDDRVGFVAQCNLYVPATDNCNLLLAANNGVQLFVDGETVLSSWRELVNDSGERSVRRSINLDAGFHTFELHYYEWDGSAKISFETNLDPLGLEEVAGLYEGALGSIDELEARIEQANETVAELQGCVEALEDELVSSEEAYATLSSDLASSESREQDFRKQIEQLESAVASSEEACAALSGGLASSELREHSLEADIQLLLDDVAGLTQQLEASALRIATLEGDVLIASQAAMDASARLDRQSQRMDAFITGSAEVLDAMAALQALEDDLASRHGQRFTHSLIAGIEDAMDEAIQQLWSVTALVGIGDASR